MEDIIRESIRHFFGQLHDKASDKLVNQFIETNLNSMWDRFIQDRATTVRKAVEALDLFLPNASKGKFYQTTITFEVDNVTDFWLEGLEETGLSVVVNPEAKTIDISGTPQTAGTFELKLRYLFDGCPRSDVPFRKLPFIINANPRDLWKDLPVPEGIDYPKEDTQKEYVTVLALADGTPQKDMVAASKRGRSHAHEGRPRDDHFRLYYSEDTQWYVIAVADGAGSAKFSREGSRIACEVAVDWCRQKLDDCAEFESHIESYHQTLQKVEDLAKQENIDIIEKTSCETDEEEARKVMGQDIYRIVGTAAFKAQKAIFDEAARAGNRNKDYGTTLLLTISKRFSYGWFVASFWVGDGAICLYDRARHTAKLMGQPDEGEYGGQTRFLTMSDIFVDAAAIMKRLRFCIVPDFTALLLMSDGVSDPWFETDANLENVEMWDRLWDNLENNAEHPVSLTDDNPEAASQLLDWLDFWSPGNHDDRTIAILY